MGSMLEQGGYQALLADGMPTAQRMLEDDPPDLVVTEIRLNGYNGLHLIATAPTPVRAVVVTAYADPAIERDARRLGADYLTKPVDAEALLAAVARQLSRGRSEDLFMPARQSPRTAVRGRVMVDVDGIPARICDLSDSGARLELPQSPAGTEAGRVALQSEGFAGSMYVAWERQVGATLWLCGVQVSDDDAERWRAFVSATLAADREPTA